MRVLLSLMVIWAQAIFAAGVLRPPSLMRPQSLVLQSIEQIADLQREVDMLVARGYVLFAGEFHTTVLETASSKEFILIKDGQNPVYRYGENETEVRSSGSIFKAKGISEGGRAQLGGDGNDVNVTNFILIPRNAGDKYLSRHGWYHYRLETADGLYPEAPAEIDNLTLITPAHTIDLTPVQDYRIYRGEMPLQVIIPGIGRQRLNGQVTETIAINGNNPYVVYRHTQVVRTSGEVSDRLSIGTYPRIAIQPSLIEEQSVIIAGRDAVGSKSYQLILDDDGNATLNYGVTVDSDSIKIPLQLIAQSDIWNKYQGNIGTTGAGIESMLKRDYFNGESSD